MGQKTVQIVGAGFAGLSLAWLLARCGCRVEIRERAARVGGLLGTHRVASGTAEAGANGILVTARLVELCREIGVEPLFALKASKRRYIWRGAPTRWPLTVGETASLVGRMAAKLLFNRRALRPVAGETLDAWGRRNLGQGAADFLLAPALQGIYAGDSKRMSASLILNPLLFKKRGKGDPHGLVSFRGGMQDLVDALERKGREAGVVFHQQQVTPEDLAQPPPSGTERVVATSAWDAAALLTGCAPALAAKLRTVEVLPLVAVTVFFRIQQNKYPGFGCLFPANAPTRALGALMNSYIFAGRAGIYNETWIFGGARDGAAINLTDQELITEITGSRQRLFGLASDMVESKITRWPQALPHYTLPWETTLQTLPELPGLHLHGNWLGGIGLSHILDRSHLLAERITRA
ncbi:MAG: hypothetical protein EPN23_08645 [Verrucomicrobia bacterium]|nr:MAG: hypothetical protein EPN23_08645 [Verrucomicrobiota bacterium]